MSPVLLMLAWSPVLVALYLAAQSLLYRAEHGVRFAARSRDDEPPPKSPYLQRAEKALRNLLETYPAFIALAVAAELGHRSGGSILWGSGLYLAARVIYLPLYVFGVPYLRSLVWLASAIGLMAMFAGAVL